MDFDKKGASLSNQLIFNPTEIDRRIVRVFLSLE
jgi:hypothetical protein